MIIYDNPSNDPRKSKYEYSEDTLRRTKGFALLPKWFYIWKEPCEKARGVIVWMQSYTRVERYRHLSDGGFWHDLEVAVNGKNL